MAYEIRLSNVPDGAYTEDYLGANRYQESYQDACDVKAGFEMAKETHPGNFEPDMAAEIIDADDDDLLRDRYQVRVIGTGAFGRILATTDSPEVAKAKATALAGDWYYGTAVIDTEAEMADLGDETVPVTEAFVGRG